MKPTKEETLEWLGEEDSNDKAWNHIFSMDFNDFVRKGICRLIGKLKEDRLPYHDSKESKLVDGKIVEENGNDRNK